MEPASHHCLCLRRYERSPDDREPVDCLGATAPRIELADRIQRGEPVGAGLRGLVGVHEWLDPDLLLPVGADHRQRRVLGVGATGVRIGAVLRGQSDRGLVGMPQRVADHLLLRLGTHHRQRRVLVRSGPAKPDAGQAR